MLANMASSLILHKRIETTLAKAKALREYIEPIITKSKDDTTHSRRTVFAYLKQKEAVTELFRVVAPKISDRPGGYGGLDLYISKKINGDWGPAVNLGPVINTSLNEDRPFLINNGKTLFFSSQGHITIGGYDLFRSDLQTNNIWSNPLNLGYPLNTPDDNIFFMPINGGKSGYYAIYKEAEGSGDYDIYKITFK
jgi:ribosomal protein L17